MQYFVSIENTPYYHWQLELLIQSFKKLNCEDKLIVAIADKKSAIYPEFLFNLSKHKKVFRHPQLAKNGYKELNPLYAMSLAIRGKILEQPFVFLKPHVILRREPAHELIKYPQIILGKSEINAELIKENCEQEFKNFIPLSPVAIFNNIPFTVFQETITLAEDLTKNNSKKELYKKIPDIAFSINLSKYSNQGKIASIKDENLISDMLENDDSNFIEYEHGMPPVFNKSLFKFSPPLYFSAGDPIKILSDNFPSKNSYYIALLAKELMEKRKHERNLL